MPSYDWVTFTPQNSAPASPAINEIYYKDADDRLCLCTDGTGAGGGAYNDLRLVEQGSAPTAARGKVYLASSNDHLYLCVAT